MTKCYLFHKEVYLGRCFRDLAILIIFVGRKIDDSCKLYISYNHEISDVTIRNPQTYHRNLVKRCQRLVIAMLMGKIQNDFEGKMCPFKKSLKN